MHRSPDCSVRNRLVFYVPGYDSLPSRRYRELYRKESALQAAVSGYDIAVKAGIDGDGFRWRVASMIDGQPTRSQVEVLVWSDIILQNHGSGIPATYRGLGTTAWTYLSTAAIFRISRLRKEPVLVALYPVVALLVQAGIAVALGCAMRGMAMRMGWELGVEGAVSRAVAYLAAILIATRTLRWFRDDDGLFHAYFLMHGFALSVRAGGAYPPELEERLATFRQKISAALASAAQEVLVVGHSRGAYLDLRVLSDLMRRQPVQADRPAVSLLSLGQLVLMVSFQPGATGMRRDPQYLSQCRDLTWVDVTAAGDACCFALCDPVAVSGVMTPGKRGPLVISAAFTKSLSQGRWRKLRWRVFRLHFQYIRAFDQPLDYDYFQISAGPLSFGARCRGRNPSASRIEVATSGYASIGL